jgi:hypothetical protein
MALFARPRHIWKDNIQMAVKLEGKVNFMYWIQPAQNRVHSRGFVNTVLDLQAPLKQEYIWRTKRRREDAIKMDLR